jgi:hypothetical protein
MSESNGAKVLWSGSIASDPEINQLLHPSRFYARPADVAGDQLLTVEERRAILSSWASDACAVDSNPTLRRPPHANGPVTFDEIMDAVFQLDSLRTPESNSETRRPRRGQSARVSAL